jgi:hypothetical protein
MHVAMADGSAQAVSPSVYADIRSKMLDVEGLAVTYFNESLERVPVAK